MQATIRLVLAAAVSLAVPHAKAAEPGSPWPAITLPAPGDVKWSGSLAAALDRGVVRLAKEPYTVPWLLADVSFEVNRIFTNYSGDVSGRFIELAALTSPPGQKAPASFAPVLAAITRYQRADGHFGVEVDLSEPLAKGSPPIPMLWGNARLLVGLVTCAEKYSDPQLLAAARRLGDFYVNTADQLCSPAREAEYRASGSYGDSYTCCYFPAIEGLAMLYRATKEERYLKQAERIAEFFRKFDGLPIDHSHGNLCAWRGILVLYEITGKRDYLDRARAKWKEAVDGGYVWPMGGVGEHWYVSFPVDEGCSESDWLRLNLDLWRFTGETRYLDLAERLACNQYYANQSANGGFGARHFDGERSGPSATRGNVEEWPWCCSFHGPLGFQFLKAYLAAGSDRGVLVNFPLNFDAPIQAAGRKWRLSVRTTTDFLQEQARIAAELGPEDKTASGRATLWIRMPGWAAGVKAAAVAGRSIAPTVDRGYVRIDGDFKPGDKVEIAFAAPLTLQGRKFQAIRLPVDRASRLREVCVLAGPHVLLASPAPSSGRPILLAAVDASGRLRFLSHDAKGCATVALAGLEATDAQIAAAIASARPVWLRPFTQVSTKRRKAFVSDLVIVPEASLPAKDLTQWASRVKAMAAAAAAPIFGSDLEKRPDVWIGSSDWHFTPDGLRVAGGDIGLIDGEGYGDYRFEFDVVLPKEGQGITGWVVRATSEADCLMFQLQTADSSYHAPEFKTRPNTLRPHVRRNARWTIADPVPLPKPVRRGETHHIAVECRGANVAVLLDGQKIYSEGFPDLRSRAVGFRASGPGEQGLFRRINLRKL